MQLLKPGPWKDYELIDAGEFEKLERFGNVITIRPEPQAIWRRSLNEKEWEKLAHVKFISKSSSSGSWKQIKNAPEQWQIEYAFNQENIKPIVFRLGLTSFKHTGIFPEQAVNWEHIATSLKRIKSERKKFLNLFAYTGGASLAARAAGADVTHVDSIRQVITWAKQNMELSSLDNIRWMVEDALKFVKREVKRGNKYHGIILDPPAYGHGPDGEKWKLEEQITEMIEHVAMILEPQEHFIILNAYSLGFSSIIIENLFKSQQLKNIDTGELYLESKSGVKLPLGVFGRASVFI